MCRTQKIIPSDTRVEMTQIVLPTHTNNLQTVFGGQVAAWIDICAAVSAQRFSKGQTVTASIDELHFLKPIKQGMIVILQSQVNYAWGSSMEVGVIVEAEDPMTGIRNKCCTSYLTFVALDDDGKKRKVRDLYTDSNKIDSRRAKEAQERRTLRLKTKQNRLRHIKQT